MADFSNIVERYNKEITSENAKTNIELEIRFSYITGDVFASLYNHLQKVTTGTLSSSVDIISHINNAKYIRHIEWVNGKSIESYHKKTHLTKTEPLDDYIKYHVSVSREEQIEKFNTIDQAFIRFKARISFTIGSWRYDLTAIKSSDMKDMNTANLEKFKNIFISITPESVTSDEIRGHIDNYEIEVEHIGDGAITKESIQSIPSSLFNMIDPGYLSRMSYQEEIYNIATYIITNKLILPRFKQPDHGIKRLLNSVISLTKSAYYNNIFPPDEYLATIKADGERCVAVINGNRLRIISSQFEEYLDGEFVPGQVSIADCELITNSDTKDYKDTKCTDTKGKKTKDDNSNHNDGKGKLLRVFDCMMLNDEHIHRYGMAMRIERIPAVVEIINKIQPIAIEAKYVTLDSKTLEKDFRSVIDAKYKYNTDGLIISEPLRPYQETTNYKWKPYELNSIDFLAVQCPKNMIGIKPYEARAGHDLYILFVGISKQMYDSLNINLIPHYKDMFNDTNPEYFPIQFSPSSNPLAHIYYHAGDNINMKIVELVRNEDNTSWNFIRLRNDRTIQKTYYGNDFKTAEMTFMNYIDKFPVSDLWDRAGAYFTKNADTIHEAPNRYKRFVISNMFKNNISNTKWIIDIAAGRGADMNRYKEIGVDNVLFIDIDPSAIAELISRKFSDRGQREGPRTGPRVEIQAYNKRPGGNYNKATIVGSKNLTVHTLVADLKTAYTDLSAKTHQFGINVGMMDGIVCNFALHYMCDTIENLRNLLMFNAKMLKTGGLFMFTVMDGATIFSMLSGLEFGQTWEVRQDGVIKYAIRRDYKDDKLSKTGQNISILLPFIDEMQSEPLCNVDMVIAEAARLGFSVELNNNMIDMMDMFAGHNKKLFNQLTEDDKHYISLFKYISMRKIKDIKLV